MATASPPLQSNSLRRGFTTGSCATAASLAAYLGLCSGTIPKCVSISLPSGNEADFTIVRGEINDGYAQASVIKDAGDDPDVTHGAEIVVQIHNSNTHGIHFVAGEGVGTVTKPGLPIGVGEAAINPVPRRMMVENIQRAAKALDRHADIVITIAVIDGEKIARKTANPRLGIVGGLSILGTSGIVIPFSCSAWIHSIHRGIDVARATGQKHIAICTGTTSERAVEPYFPISNIIDIGGFFGGFCKYFRAQPLAEVTLAAGIGKLVKIAQGENILHGNRSRVNFGWLAGEIARLGDFASESAYCAQANTVLDVVEQCQHTGIIERICHLAAARLHDELGQQIRVHVLAINRTSEVIGRV